MEVHFESLKLVKLGPEETEMFVMPKRRWCELIGPISTDTSVHLHPKTLNWKWLKAGNNHCTVVAVRSFSLMVISGTVKLTVAGFGLQCHNELGNISEATNWAELALKMPRNTENVRAHILSTFEFIAAAFSPQCLFYSKDEETCELEAELQDLTARNSWAAEKLSFIDGWVWFLSSVNFFASTCIQSAIFNVLQHLPSEFNGHAVFGLKNDWLKLDDWNY